MGRREMGLRQRIGAWTAASDHGRLVGVFILMSLAGSLWAITSPLMSVPDEPAHTAAIEQGCRVFATKGLDRHVAIVTLCVITVKRD